MESKVKKYLIALIASAVAMFLWIVIAVALTGGRDVGEFTAQDQVIMKVFMVVEFATVAVMLILAAFLGKNAGAIFRRNIQSVPAVVQPNVGKHGIILTVLAFVASLALMITGIVVGDRLPESVRDVCPWLLGISFVIAAAGLGFNVLMKKWYLSRLEKRQVSQVYQYIQSHRENARQTAAQKLRLIKLWRMFTGLYAVTLGFLGLCVAACGGILNKGAHLWCMLGFLLMICALARIRFPVSKKLFGEESGYVSREQYPIVYAIAEKAAQATGCQGDIRIALRPDCNAAIAKIGQIYSVQMGVVMLNVFSEEELYSVLLHEFSHVTAENSQSMGEGMYHAWLCGGGTPHFTSGITKQFFAFLDSFYTMQYSLYFYAATIQMEMAADKAMLRSGKPDAVASALRKLKYYDLFEWEKGTQDEPCVYQPEESVTQVIAQQIQKFLQALSQNAEKWNQLLNVEIQSRSASHPTVRERLAALGIESYGVMAAPQDTDYAKECEKALHYIDDLISEDLKEVYQERRKVFYLEPKEQVENWEAAGKPVVAEEYGDIVWALRQLGRNSDAIALCDRAIAELSNIAATNGYFIRGCYRLHSYDEAGIQDIYFAIEHNASNYLQEGIDAIGSFCCLTGNQKELDLYRQKAVELAQKHKDQYSQVSVLTKKDHLSEEKLPDGMLEDVLEYIRSIDHGQIEKIYLVRKTISENFFTSVFVIRFDLKAEEDECGEILHKIYRYLDTCSDWQFSLFDYQEVMSVPLYKIPNSCVYTKSPSALC